MRSRSLPGWTENPVVREVAVGVLYYGAARSGFGLALERTIVSPVWPPSGIALAAVLLLGERIGPVILLGAFLAGLGGLLAGGHPFAASVAAAGGIAAGNAAEALLGAFLLRRFAGFPHSLDLPVEVFRFAALAGALSCVVAATVGVASLCLGGFADAARAGALWWTWWLGDTTGVLLVTPFLLAWSRQPRLPPAGRRLAEAALLVTVSLVVSLLVFGIWPPPGRAGYPHPLAYLTLPALIWAALRFGQRGATTAILLMSSVALWGTTHGVGPFARESPSESLLSLQTFLGLMALTVLVLSAALAERRRGEEALRASEARYRCVAEIIPAALLTMDEAGAILFANPAAEEIFGYAVGEMLGQNLTMLMPEPMRPAHRRGVERYLATHQRHPPWRGREFPGLHKSGREIALEVSCGVLVEDGRTVFTGFLQDAGRRRRAEEESAWRARELAALSVLIAAAGGSPETPEVLAALKQQLAERLGFSSGAILLREEPGDDLRLRESWGLSEDLLGAIQHLPEPLFASCSVLGTNTCVTIPLPAGGQGPIHGLLLLFSPASPRSLEKDLFFFETLGRQVGGTLGNARQIQSLSRRLVMVQEQERTLLAHELHDQIGQMLTGLKLTLEMSQRVPPEAAGAKLNAARELASDLIARVRGMSLDLRPSMLDDFGLLPALSWHCKRYTAQTGVRVAFEHQDLEGRRFPSLVETAAYRSVQEALTNVARHAGVAEAQVRLWLADDLLLVRIADRGAGFDPEAVRRAGGTSGLAGMRERARLLGGRLEVVSSPGRGTTVTAEFPVDAVGEEKERT
jgi:PAS domain S-box-containing protein